MKTNSTPRNHSTHTPQPQLDVKRRVEKSREEKKDICRVDEQLSDTLPEVPVQKYNGAVKRIFEQWRSTLHPKAKLISKRKKLIESRLRDGYSEEDLKKAIDGVKLSAFHMGDNEHGVKYTQLKTIFRDGEQIEKFAGYVDSPPVAPRRHLEKEDREVDAFLVKHKRREKRMKHN